MEARLTFACTAPLLGMIVAIGLATIVLCHGHLIYNLDDPYISLSLGWHIGHGHYGLNDGEAASPSSSILWPFLLAGFAWTSFQEWVPVVVNSLAAAGTAALFAATALTYGIASSPGQVNRVAFLIVVLCLAINTVGLVFTGLEHSLHAVTSVAIVIGLARVLEGEKPPAWLVPAMVLAPLWRFEGLALAAGAAIALMLAAQWRAAFTAIGMIVVTVGGYMVAMTLMGLPALPSSVMVKWTPVALLEPGVSVVDFLRFTLGNYYRLQQWWSVLVTVLLVTLHPLLRLPAVALIRGPYRLTLARELIFAGVLSGALLAHVVFGASGGFYRYEAYAVAFGAAGAVILWHTEISVLLGGARPRVAALIAGTILLAVNYGYVFSGTLRTPAAALGIYDQQYQMHRFAVEFYGRPVAVNDLGWVSYRNPNYVLDLWGLGSETAREARVSATGPGWMDYLVHVHGVGVAMIYDARFRNMVPQDWVPLGILTARHATISNGGSVVSFWATSPEAKADAMPAFRRFADAVSRGARVSIAPDNLTHAEFVLWKSSNTNEGGR